MKKFKQIFISSGLVVSLMLSACGTNTAQSDSPELMDDNKTTISSVLDSNKVESEISSVMDDDADEFGDKDDENDKDDADDKDDSLVSKNPNMYGEHLNIIEIQNRVFDEFGRDLIIKSIEFDEDNGKYYYDVQVEMPTEELDLNLDAASGEILETEKDQSDDFDKYRLAIEKIISLEEAHESIIKYHGDAQAFIYKIELDLQEIDDDMDEKDDDDYSTYEGKLRSNGQEYAFKMNAETSEVLELEPED